MLFRMDFYSTAGSHGPDLARRPIRARRTSAKRSGAWQLYSIATGLNLAVYADFATCRQAAVTGPDMSCKPATIVLPASPTPPIVQPPIVTTPTMNSAFRIDASSLPKGSAGDAYDRLQYTSELAKPSDIGAFRIPCAYSHMAFDDPIVYPGRPGAAHLHTFFGNTGTNAASTEQSSATPATRPV